MQHSDNSLEFPFKLWQRMAQTKKITKLQKFAISQPSSVDCVVVAAGIGSRMQADRPKQYLPLGDKTLLEWTVCQILQAPSVRRVVLVLHPQDQYFAQTCLAQDPDLAAMITTVTGGKERVDSVCCGLQAVETEWCMVHDAARPFVHVADIENLVALGQQAYAQSQHCKQVIQGAILAVPETDTVKQKYTTESLASNQSCSKTMHSANLAHQSNDVSIELKTNGTSVEPKTNDACEEQTSHGANLFSQASLLEHLGGALIQTTLDRSQMYRAQTPQLFRTNYLLSAILQLQAQGKVITDEASVIDFDEHSTALLVTGSPLNFKITTPADLVISQALLDFYTRS